MSASPLLTTREVSEWLGVAPKTVLRRWRAGELPGFRIGTNALRFDEADIEAWLLERRHGSSRGEAYERHDSEGGHPLRAL